MTEPQQEFQFSPYWVDGINTPGFNWEKFQDKIDVISDDIFNLLVDETTSEFIKSLTQKYVQLNACGPNIARLIRDVALGDIFIGDMPAEIAKLGLDQTTAREAANSIVSELFTPVLEDIKAVQSAKFPEKISPKPSVSSTESQPAAPPIQPPPVGESSQFKVTPPPSRNLPFSTIQQTQKPSPAPPTKTPEEQTPPKALKRYPGEDLPETGGNIIDLRNQR